MRQWTCNLVAHKRQTHRDDVVRFIMRRAELELYELLVSKISKNLSVIRPDRKFFRQDHRNKTNKHPINQVNVCIKSLS